MSEPRYQITVKDMGGWARAFLARGEPAGQLAIPLSQCLTEWMQKNPKLRVKFIVPITSNGDTSELHAWYEVVSDPSVAAPRDEGKSPE